MGRIIPNSSKGRKKFQKSKKMAQIRHGKGREVVKSDNNGLKRDHNQLSLIKTTFDQHL